MKPFDIEAAKRGDPVQTIKGKPVRILCFDRKVGELGDEILYLVSDGDFEILYAHFPAIAEKYLVMAPVKRTREVWINVYQYGSARLYHSKDAADQIGIADRLACIPVTLEWEE